MNGRTVTVTPLDIDRDTGPLYDVLGDAPDSIWTYMSFGPFVESTDLGTTLRVMIDDPTWQPYTFTVDDRALGFASYLRIQPRDGVIEIGAITLSPEMQRTTPATEALLKKAEAALSGSLRGEFVDGRPIATLAIAPAKLKAMPLTAPERYLLSRVDGSRDVASIVQVSPLNELEALKLFQKLVDLGLVKLHRPD